MLCDKYGLLKNDYDPVVAKLQRTYKKNIHSHIARKLAYRAYYSINNAILNNGKKLHYTRDSEFYSIEGEVNSTGIVYKNDFIIYFSNLKLKVKRNPNNQRETELLKNKVKYCRLKRKWIRNKWKYYADLVLECVPPKLYRQNILAEHEQVSKRIGIDIGLHTVAVVSESNANIFPLAKEIEPIEKKLRLINISMKNSRMSTNPMYYKRNGKLNEAGRLAKKHGGLVFSNHYKNLSRIRKDLKRKEVDIRKQTHCILANEILEWGNEIYVEKMDYTKIAKSKGKGKSRTYFGIAISNRGPSMFLRILKEKVIASDGKFIEVDRYKARASQYCHLNQEYSKKPLTLRWNSFPDGNIIQRDIYSAFLLMNTNETSDGFDQSLCDKNYPSFIISCGKSKLLK